MTETRERIEGVVIGLLIGFDGGVPLVVFVGNPTDCALPARSLAALAPADVGAEVALLFEGGDPARPLIVGRLVEPPRRTSEPEIVKDGERVVVTGRERIELRCGAAAVILEKSGRITIRGSEVVSQASGTNRVRGGTIQLN